MFKVVTGRDIELEITKTGTPGNLYITAILYYRKIAT